MTTTSSNTTPPSRKLRWFQYRLRTLLIFTVIVALTAGCGSWFVVKRQRAQRQRAALQRLGMAGATWEYDYYTESHFGSRENVRPPPPALFRRMLGDDAFADVVGVFPLPAAPSQNVPRMNDATLAELEAFPRLQSLDLGWTKITDAGLVHLEGLTHLEFLDLHSTSITDAGLVHIGGLAELRSLWLYNTRITDAGLVHVGGLRKLTHLYLWDTGITDAGLAHLEGLRELELLELDGRQVSEAGVAKLRRVLPNCMIRK